MPRITVHEKALAHLSRGLYRSPASALRELVSNAWDANATYVRINTNYPNFLQLVVEDNGDGFTKGEFERLMSGGIGNSDKRPKQLVLKKGRPVIGRLGIGMLGIAQVCGSFTITSKTSGGQGFKAKVRLYDLLKEKLDQGTTDLIRTASTNEAPAVEVDVGEYELETFDAETTRRGTRIIADDLHPTFVRSFKESTEFEAFREPPLDWAKALREIRRVHSLQQLGDYWRLLWELAAACPIPYVSERAIPGGLIKQDQTRLESHDFRLIVDSIELRKPVNLSGNEFGYSTWRLGPHTERVYGKDLAFHGYILVQEGKQLQPDELRGIMIRINNVAIGYYDPSLLDYRFNEGPRAKWVTGEIYVESGLEDALNIDRDSFNRFHPHFRSLQKFVHEFLQRELFPGTYKKIDERSQVRRAEKASQRTQQLKKVIASTIQAPVEVRSVTRPADRAVADVRVDVIERGESLRLELPRDIPTKKSNRQLASSVLALFEIAIREKTKDKQREIFAKLLLELLEKW